MNLRSEPVTMAPVPPCARLAAICAAIDGREVTCPAAAQRTCATLAAIRRIASLAEGRPAA